MANVRSLAALTATVAIALIVWSCETPRNAVAPAIGRPLFHFNVFTCSPLKMTGGGRIDRRQSRAGSRRHPGRAHWLRAPRRPSTPCSVAARPALEHRDLSLRHGGQERFGVAVRPVR